MKYTDEQFSKERALSFVNEMMPLGVLHHKEIFGDSIEFTPDITSLGVMWEAKAMKVITARDDSNKLCGYLLLSMPSSLWNNDYSFADVIAHYVSEEHRGAAGKQIIKYALDLIKSMGKKGLRFVADKDSRYEKLLPRLGAKQSSSNYSLEELK